MGFSAAKGYMMFWTNSHYRSSQNIPWKFDIEPENIPSQVVEDRLPFPSFFRGVCC